MRLQRLNLDNTWHIEIGGQHLLIDPWLHGPEIDYFSWFNTQWHRTAPIPYPHVPPFDAVLITQKYPDHFHIETLQRLSPKHIFAPVSLERKIRSLFPTVEYTGFPRTNPVVHWNGITVTWLHTRRRIDPIYDSVVIDDGVESVIVSPHGLDVDEQHQRLLQNVPDQPVLLSPLSRFQLPALLGGLVSPGLSGLQALVNAVSPSRIYRTHDEQKHGRGLIPTLAKIDVVDEQHAYQIDWLKARYHTLDHYEPVHLSRSATQ